MGEERYVASVDNINGAILFRSVANRCLSHHLVSRLLQMPPEGEWCMTRTIPSVMERVI